MYGSIVPPKKISDFPVSAAAFGRGYSVICLLSFEGDFALSTPKRSKISVRQDMPFEMFVSFETLTTI